MVCVDYNGERLMVHTNEHGEGRVGLGLGVMGRWRGVEVMARVKAWG